MRIFLLVIGSLILSFAVGIAAGGLAGYNAEFAVALGAFAVSVTICMIQIVKDKGRRKVRGLSAQYISSNDPEVRRRIAVNFLEAGGNVADLERLETMHPLRPQEPYVRAPNVE